MKLRITILVICFLFGDSILFCQNQIGVIDFDSLSTRWMEELGLDGIKNIYHEKLKEVGEKQFEYLQDKYMNFNAHENQRLTDEEIQKEQEEFAYDRQRLADIELSQTKLDEEFDMIQEKLKHLLLDQLNEENTNEYLMILDKESIIFLDPQQELARNISVQIPRRRITSKIEKLFLETLTELRGFIDSYRVLSK